MDLITKIFDLKRNIHMLHICERLNLPPASEISTLLTIKKLNERAGDDKISVSEIASLLNVSVPTVSRCLQKLVAKGYINKTLNEKDRRGMVVTLTPQGQEVCRRAQETIDPLIQKVLSHLEPAELDQFFCTIDKLYDAVYTELRKI